MSARVLVIDDSPVTVQLLTEALVAAGLEVDAATDLAALDARLAGAPYGLVLVDVNMPEMYGDDVVEFLRRQRGLTGRLLLYSDLPGPELERRAAASGADGYLTKASGLEAAVDRVRAELGLGAPAARQRVLLVDDSESTLRLLKAELEARGHEVLTASSAEAATRIILKKKTRPSLVLLDVRMPGVDGEALCRFIKTNSLFAGIQVLLCSAESTGELERIVREAGADGYVRKDALIAREILDLLE